MNFDAWNVETVDLSVVIASAIRDEEPSDLVTEIRLMRNELRDLRREVASLRDELAQATPSRVRISPFSLSDSLVRLS
jgi:hypothetical protein